MFTFALASCPSHWYFSLHFQALYTLHRKRKSKALQRKTTDHNYYMSGKECRIDRFACFAAFFSSFPTENAFQSLEENLWTINRNGDFRLFSDFDNTKIFRDLVKIFIFIYSILSFILVFSGSLTIFLRNPSHPRDLSPSDAHLDVFFF